MGKKWIAAALVSGFGLAACGGGETEMAEEPTNAHADSVMLAAEQYDPAAFDTIQWDDQDAALGRGATVWRISCAKCHGPQGAGDGHFVQRGDTLFPPSFVEPDWQFAEDTEGLRAQIYQGTTEGMPHWGLYGLKYRDIDAVAAYIQNEIR